MVVVNVNSVIAAIEVAHMEPIFLVNAVTLLQQMQTGNLTIRLFSIVQSIVYDEAKGKASGVRII